MAAPPPRPEVQALVEETTQVREMGGSRGSPDRIRGLLTARGTRLPPPIVLESPAFWLFVLATALPGVLICGAAGLYLRDGLLLQGQGCALGLSLPGSTFLGSHAVGVPWRASVVPFLIAVVALAASRRRSEVGPAGTVIRAARDNVQLQIRGGFVELWRGPVPSHLLFPPELFRLEFANAARHVYCLELPP